MFDLFSIATLPIPLPLKSPNRSLKSELTNIQPLDLGVMEDQLPGCGEASFWRLRLPELEIDDAIQLVDPTPSFNESRSCHA